MRSWIVPSLIMCLLMWVACDPTVAPPEQVAEVVKDSGVADTTPPQERTPDSAPDKRVTPPESATRELRAPDAVPDQVPDLASPDLTPPEPRPESGKPDMTFANLTYWKDTKAIIDTKCNLCHQSGGIGPFTLEDYSSVSKLKAVIKSEVAAGKMPPWSADRSCVEYTNDISLTPTEKAKLLQWIGQGAPEGDKNDYVAPPPAPKVGLKRVDLTLKMPKEYVINKIPDDYRCFVVDWTPKTTKYITGFQVRPGNAKVVHHMIAYMATKAEAARYTKKDPNGNGYSCYGTAGGPAALRWIGIWAPGVPGAELPTGTGIRVEPGAKIIIQLHYNAFTKGKEKDTSAIDFTLEDKVQKEAIYLPHTNPEWFLGRQPMKIPANNANVKHSFNLPLALLNFVSTQLASITLYSVTLHLHQLGKSGKLTIGDPGTSQQCLLNIPRWDFNWQLAYNMKKPITLSTGDSIGISCTWDNSQANQPIVNGQQQQSRDVDWGDGTQDEMCLGVLYITCQDKNNQAIRCPDLGNAFSRLP